MKQATPLPPEHSDPKAPAHRLFRAATLWVVAVFTYLLIVPRPLGESQLVDFVRSLHWSGYLVHFLTYVGLGTMVLALGRTLGRRAFPAGIILLAAHACLTEVAQVWIPARSPDVWDALANIGGLAAACLLCLLPGVVRKPAIAV